MGSSNLKRRIESSELDRVIYHYCDANALLSILHNKKLRFTHAAYLNDTLEIRHGVTICKQLLEERLKHNDSDPVLTNTVEYLENAERWQYYVCCFSESKDKLSQWRAYANDGDGFAIGFNTRDFRVGTDGPFEGRFNKVEYSSEAIAEKANKLLDEYCATAHVFQPDSTPELRKFAFENSAAHVGNILIDESVFIKDAGFLEEQEWRAVRSYKLEDTETERALVDEGDPGDMIRIFQDLQKEFLDRRLVRSGRYGLTPYIEVEFRPESIREIVCGPRTSPKLTETSLSILKKKYGLTFEVSRSAATYR
jgi:hypothetical protein